MDWEPPKLTEACALDQLAPPLAVRYTVVPVAANQVVDETTSTSSGCLPEGGRCSTQVTPPFVVEYAAVTALCAVPYQTARVPSDPEEKTGDQAVPPQPADGSREWSLPQRLPPSVDSKTQGATLPPPVSQRTGARKLPDQVRPVS